MINFDFIPTATLISTTVRKIRGYSYHMNNYVHYVKYTKNQYGDILERHYAQLNALEDCIDILLRELESRNAIIPNQYMKSYLNSQRKREETLI